MITDLPDENALGFFLLMKVTFLSDYTLPQTVKD